jgi:glycosyltransferase involved in cell wall biosynthesis
MYPPHSLGGYEEVWRSATVHLREQGHEVRVLTTDFRREDVAGPEDADVHRELRWYWREHEFPKLGWGEQIALERHNRQALERHLGDLAPDVIAWWAMGGMSLSLLDRPDVPAAAFVHDDWLVYGPLVDRRTRRRARLGRRFRPREDVAWTFNSERTRRVAQEAHPGLRPTAVISPGVDPGMFAPAEPGSWSWRLLCAGRIDERKGIRTAIRALAGLPEAATLTVFGSGDEREVTRLRSLVRDLGLDSRVHFESGARSAMPSAYAAADCVLFPVEWDEPWGLVPLEAMAVGRPVVATGRGGSAEYLRDGENCLLFTAGDPSSLEAAVRRLAEDEALRAHLRTNGHRTAAAYSEESFNRAVETALRASADSGSSPASR